MPTETPSFMEPAAAAAILRTSVANPEKPLTIADAAAAGGLALRDAERGLHWLTSEYRGHLRVTNDGDLLFLFPTGFTKPWETRDRFMGALRSAGRVAAGVGRFVVRAWVSIVLVAYAALFLAIVIGGLFARSDNRRSSGLPGGALAYVFFRVLADALFWTFHPFSPLYVNAQGWGGRRAAPKKDAVPFYEKVNRFFFGPPPVAEDPRAMERKILAELRAQKGRIGLADVMRVTGLPRDEADPMMARLMLDYEGDVEVSNDGGIWYRFEAIRKTARDEATVRPEPAWAKEKRLAPLTGNTVGANILIAGLNLFNLIMSASAIDANLTITRLVSLFHHVPDAPPLPYDGVPIVLGVVPLVFSIALFVLPLVRGLLRPLAAKKVAKENGRLRVLQEIVTRVETKSPIPEKALVDAWKSGAGAEPASKELTREVVALGGDVDIGENGEVRYRFADLETEAAALEAEREAAPEEEAKVGKVIFASDR